MTIKLCLGILCTFFVCLFLIGWGCLLNLQPVNSVPHQENSTGTERCLCSTDALRKSGVGILEKPFVLSHCLKIPRTKSSCQNTQEVPKKMSERQPADTLQEWHSPNFPPVSQSTQWSQSESRVPGLIEASLSPHIQSVSPIHPILLSKCHVSQPKPRPAFLLPISEGHHLSPGCCSASSLASCLLGSIL